MAIVISFIGTIVGFTHHFSIRFSKISKMVTSSKRKIQHILPPDAKKKKLSVSNFNNLPPEMVEKILKLLKINEICQAKLICKRWKEIIDKGNILKKAAGKYLRHLAFT